MTARVGANYRALRTYWSASQASPGGEEETDSLKALGAIGFIGPIAPETRCFYLDRLRRLLGDRITPEQRVDMVLRLFACVLMHRQVDLSGSMRTSSRSSSRSCRSWVGRSPCSMAGSICA